MRASSLSHLWRVTALAALIVVLVAVPLTDVFAFGIHEHTTAVDQKGDADELTRADHSGHMVSHHCDFSMTPGEVAPHDDLPVPLPVTLDACEAPPSHPRYTPFVPFSPPRS